MILVIGGTGTVGREVVRLLSGRGAAIRALVRDPFAASSLAGPGLELVQGDLSRPEALATAFRGVSRVFLVTPSGPTTVPLQSAAITAAATAGVERLVRVSVLGVGSGVPASLVAWHGEVESLLADSGVPGVNLRPTSMMQNLLAQAGAIRATGGFIGGSGDGRVPFVDARDVAAAAVGALLAPELPESAVSLTGPDSLSGDDLAHQLGEALGRPVRYLDLDREAYRAALGGAGLPEWLAEDLSLLEMLSRGRTLPVSDGVERLSGTPARSFATFARDYRPAFG